MTNNFFLIKLIIPNSIPWEWFIDTVFKFITIYSIRIIVAALAVRILIFPIEIIQRNKMRKNEKISRRLAPQIEHLKETYANDKHKLAQAQLALQRKEGFSMKFFFLYIFINLFVFITFFNSVQNISNYMLAQEYLNLYDVYQETLTKTEQTKLDYYINQLQEPLKEAKKQAKDDAILAAQKAVDEKYWGTAQTKGIHEQFLWVKSIWSSDSLFEKPIKTRQKFIKQLGNWGDVTKKVYKNYDANTLKKIQAAFNQYDIVMAQAVKNDKNGNNGFCILGLLAGILMFLSQIVMMTLQKKSGMSVEYSKNMNIVMRFVVPIVYTIIAISYSAAFSIYSVVSSAFTLVFNIIFSLINNYLDKNQDKKIHTRIQKHGRPDPTKKY